MADNNICPHFGLCGGCSYQDKEYGAQLSLKEEKVRELLAPYADESVWEKAVSSPLIYGYRNKMEFSFGDDKKDGPLTLGLHQKKSFYNVITVDGCNIVDEDYRLIISETLKYFGSRGVSYYHKRRGSGALRHLVIRKALKTGELLVCLVTTSDIYGYEKDVTKAGVLPHSCGLLEGYEEMLLGLPLRGGIAGILHMENNLPADTVQSQKTTALYGKEYFFEELLGLKFKITPFSFFQTNSSGAEKLYETVREYCGDISGQKVFDLYSGTGTIAQLLAAVAHDVTGVEIVEEAVNAARENAGLNGLSNCSFIAGDVFKVLSEAGETMGLPDVIVLDPPREGMTAKALSKILSYEVPRLVYVSCKPESLARDMETIAAHGYRIERIRCVDMFPWTRHVETVVLLSREKVDEYVDIDLDVEKLEGKSGTATYKELKTYIEREHGFKVSTLYIAQIKDKVGLEKRDAHWIKPAKGTVPICPPEKEEAIMDAFRHYNLI